MKKVTAYQCEFCRSPKLFLSRSGAKRHEDRCWLNPARKSCATCMNLDEGVEELEPYGMTWRCLENVCTPFKQKVENCPYYEQSTPFNDEER